MPPEPAEPPCPTPTPRAASPPDGGVGPGTTTQAETEDRARAGPGRAASWVFALLVLVAGPLYAVAGRTQWFVQDEWHFLAERDGGSLDSLLTPHNEHWTTVPVALYRILWNVVGLHHYEPYQALAIGTHLLTVVLVHALMRRTGVAPWIATAAAALLLFFGSGWEAIVWGFEITFTGALALGLAQLLLADSPAPGRARSAAALACGLGALMCSGVGIVMVGVVGLALSLRHGWRAAARQVVPLAAVYLAWWAAYGRDAGRADGGDPVEVAAFVGRGLGHALLDAGRGWPLAVAVVGVAAVGLGLGARSAPAGSGPLRRRLGLPLALAAGAAAYFALSGFSRVAPFGTEFATNSRYSYVALALLLPALALGLDGIARRWPRATVPVVLLLVAGIPANVTAIDVKESPAVPSDQVLALASSDDLAAAPAGRLPFPEAVGERSITAGWLASGVADGRIPVVDGLDPDATAEARALLALETDGPATGGPCQPLDTTERVRVGPGEAVGIVGVVWVTVLTPEGGRSEPRRVGSLEGRSLTTSGAPLALELRPDPRPFPDAVCPPRPA